MEQKGQSYVQRGTFTHAAVTTFGGQIAISTGLLFKTGRNFAVHIRVEEFPCKPNVFLLI